jgi:hypothetical protein
MKKTVRFLGLDVHAETIALAAAGPVLDPWQKQRQLQKQPHRCAGVDRGTPYQSGFGNCVDRNFVSIPPIPQKEADWMEHGSL